MRKPTVTLDTSAIIAYWKRETQGSAVQKIIEYEEGGRINLALVTRAVADLARDKDIVRKKRQLQEVKRFPAIGSTLRFDTPGSTLNGPDFLVDKKSFNRLKNILFPGLARNDKDYIRKIYDIDHLWGHIRAGRSFFVTTDRHFLNKKEEIVKDYCSQIYTPEDCLEELEKLWGKTQ